MQNYFSQQQRPQQQHPQTRQNWAISADKAQNQFSFQSPTSNDPIGSQQFVQPEPYQPNFQSQQLQARQTVSSPLRNNQVSLKQREFSQTQNYNSSHNPNIDSSLSSDFQQHQEPVQERDPKIQAKLQTQQDRLKYLDNYRIICEKRIRDLAPQHPLPVLPSHCGQPNPDIEEMKNRLRLQLQNQQDASVNQIDVVKMRGIVEQMANEKIQLEEALRQETLANEEQRNYIEILRKAIDQKMENIGLGDMLSHKNLPKGQDPVSIYSFLSELKRECDGWKKECKTLQDKLSIQGEQLQKEHEIEQNLKVQIEDQLAQNETLLSELEKLQEQTKTDQKRLDDIQKEKNQLLDYVEDNVKQIEALGNELEQERIKIEQINIERDDLKSQNKEHRANNLQLTNDLKDLREKEAQMQELIEQLKEQNRQFKKISEQQNQQLTDNDVKMNDMNELIEQQKLQIIDKSQTIESLKQTNRDLEQDCMQISKEKERITEERNIIEKRAKVEEESLKKRIAMHEDYAKQQDAKIKEIDETYIKDIEIIKQANEQKVNEMTIDKNIMKDKISGLEKLVENLQKQRESLAEENSKQIFEQRELKNQIADKQNEIITLKQRTQEALEEIDKLKNQCLQLEEQYIIESQRREWLSQERERLASQLDITSQKLDQEVVSNESLNKKLSYLEKDIVEQRSSIQRELSHKTDESLQLMRQNDTLSSDLKKTSSQLEYFRGLKADLEQRLVDMQRDLDHALREKRICEKQVQDLREENEQLFKNEDKLKRYIEENEGLKSQIRQKDRDMVIMNDRYNKVNGELENADMEIKRLQKDLNDHKYMNESGERHKNEINNKYKETEKRLYEIHKEKQELESKNRILQKQMEDLLQDNERYKRVFTNKDEQKYEMEQQIGKLRQKQSEQSIMFENWSNSTEEIEILIKAISEKAKQYLNQVLQRVNASETLQEIIPRSYKEQAYLLLQTLDNYTVAVSATSDSQFDKLKGMIPLILEIRNFFSLFTDQYELITSELLQSKQDQKILDTKVEQLEQRIGSIHTSDVLQNEKNKFLNTEVENLRSQKMKFTQDMRVFKDSEQQLTFKINELNKQVQTLQNENKFLVDKIQSIQTEKDQMGVEINKQIDEKERENSEIQMKDYKIAMISKEKRQVEELCQKLHQLSGSHEKQRLIGEIIRSMNERFKIENNRMKYELSIDDLEKELSLLLKDKLQNEESSYTRAQFLRREINDIEEKLRECDAKIEQLMRQERNIEGELKIYSDKQVIDHYSGGDQQTNTINYLTKESQDLRNELVMKNAKIQELEYQLQKNISRPQLFDVEGVQNNDTQQIENYLSNKSRNQNISPFISNSNSLGNTFERQLFHQRQSSKFMNGPPSTDSNFKVLNLQPIKVEDYDIKPERGIRYEQKENNYGQENYNSQIPLSTANRYKANGGEATTLSQTRILGNTTGLDLNQEYLSPSSNNRFNAGGANDHSNFNTTKENINNMNNVGKLYQGSGMPSNRSGNLTSTNKYATRKDLGTTTNSTKNLFSKHSTPLQARLQQTSHNL